MIGMGLNEGKEKKALFEFYLGLALALRVLRWVLPGLVLTSLDKILLVLNSFQK